MECGSEYLEKVKRWLNVGLRDRVEGTRFRKLGEYPLVAGHRLMAPRAWRLPLAGR